MCSVLGEQGMLQHYRVADKELTKVGNAHLFMALLTDSLQASVHLIGLRPEVGFASLDLHKHHCVRKQQAPL